MKIYFFLNRASEHAGLTRTPNAKQQSSSEGRKIFGTFRNGDLTRTVV
jgi:hypothetical protein